MKLLDRFRLAVDKDSTRPDWVVLDLHGPYHAYRSADPIQTLLRQADSLEGLTDRLRRLGEAEWVRGVLVRVGRFEGDLATAHTIGHSLARLSGRKRVVGYLPQVSMRSLLVTAGLDEVLAPESAEVQLPGFAAEQLFFGAFLDRHGITFENLRIGEYKAALTPFSESGMDEKNREQLTAYLESAEARWSADVAEPRGAAGVPDANHVSAHQLLDAGLLTRVAYDDEICTVVDGDWQRALELALPGTFGLKRGLGLRGRGGKDAKGEVAVVPVVGPIVTGRSRGMPTLPFTPGQQAGSDTVVAALRKADRDEDVKAIVLYVDSPGGSAVASDLICRAVARATTPVVAVMGPVAASGGYYVAAQADRVVADPYTITGSIGVVVGKPVLSGFDDAHGLRPEAVGRESALFASPHRPFSDADRTWAEQMMNDVYGRFVDRVATGRGLEPDRVDRLGRGRIWSGSDAAEVGLVDELGGLEAGLDLARRLGDLPEDAPAKPISHGFQLPGTPAFAVDPTALATDPVKALSGLWPFGSEVVLTWFDRAVTIR